MEVLIERCAGMGVHRDTIVVSVITTNESGEIEQETHTFGTLTKNLFDLL